MSSVYDDKCRILGCCELPLVPYSPVGQTGGLCSVCEKAHPQAKEGARWPSATLEGVRERTRSGWSYPVHIYYCDSKDCETTSRRTLAHTLSRCALPVIYIKGWDDIKAREVAGVVCPPETLEVKGGWKRFSQSKQEVQGGFCLGGFHESRTTPGECLVRMGKINDLDGFVDVPLKQVIQYNLAAMKALGPLGEIVFPLHFPEPCKASYRAMVDQWNATVNGTLRYVEPRARVPTSQDMLGLLVKG